jgi:hypothetical protein
MRVLSVAASSIGVPAGEAAKTAGATLGLWAGLPASPNCISIGVSDDTIERVCQSEGERVRRWLNRAAEPVARFAAQSGRPEFYGDGLKINTTDGWREMRLNLPQKRDPAAPCEPNQCKDRVLPEATIRLATCAISDSRLVGGDVEEPERSHGAGAEQGTQRAGRRRAVDLGTGGPAIEPPRELMRGRVHRAGVQLLANPGGLVATKMC